MRTLLHRTRASSVDARVWLVTALLVGWPLVGVVAESDPLLAFATPLLYPYLFVVRIGGDVVHRTPIFWTGFALYCSLVATVLVAALDRIRDRWVGWERPRLTSVLED
jgi:hypothetical protein